MQDDDGFLAAIRAARGDDVPRLIYADWLEERGDPRCDFIRLHLALTATAPDHVDRVAGEHELSELRKGCSRDWLTTIEPERASINDDASQERGCRCFDIGYGKKKGWPAPGLHAELQDTECDAWKRLLDLIEEAAEDGREEFAPLYGMSFADRSKILTLPASIAKLKGVKTLNLYGSSLIRIPPEIAEMTSLAEFTPYTSYQLHWFPFEITRCPGLRESVVSTRALYGNNKYRPPFPALSADAPAVPGRTEPVRLPLKRRTNSGTRPCSVCDRSFEDRRLHRAWISLRVATDVLPLLVNACSKECIGRLPTPPDGYVRGPHQGGMGVQQPAGRYPPA